MTLVAVIAYTVTAAAQELKPANPRAQDETAIREKLKQMNDGWKTRDAELFAKPFATDADYVVVNGMHAKGREEIEKGHTAIFTTFYKDSHNVATVKSVRYLRPDVAVAHVEWNLEFKVNGETKKGHAVNTMVVTKDGGKWSIAAFQNTAIEAQGR